MCHALYIKEKFLNDSVNAIGQGASIIADALVLVSTWCKTYYTVQLSQQANLPGSLAAVLLRDGQCSFMASYDPLLES